MTARDQKSQQVNSFLILMWVIERAFSEFLEWARDRAPASFDPVFREHLVARSQERRPLTLRSASSFLGKNTKLDIAVGRNFRGDRDRMGGAAAALEALIGMRNAIMHGSVPEDKGLDDAILVSAEVLASVRMWIADFSEEVTELFDHGRYFDLDAKGLWWIATKTSYPVIVLSIRNHAVPFYFCPTAPAAARARQVRANDGLEGLWVSCTSSNALCKLLDLSPANLQHFVLREMERVSAGAELMRRPPAIPCAPDRDPFNCPFWMESRDRDAAYLSMSLTS